MRKRELVHFHALLDRIRWFVSERDDLSEANLERYEALDVAPTAVYRSKQAHEDAVVTLTESLAEAVERPPEQGSTDRTDGSHDIPRDGDDVSDDSPAGDHPASVHGD